MMKIFFNSCKPHATFLHTQVKFQTFSVKPVVDDRSRKVVKLGSDTGKKLNFIKDFWGEIWEILWCKTLKLLKINKNNLHYILICVMYERNIPLISFRPY